jgi:hypothetical protein
MSFPRQERVLLIRDFYVNVAVADLSAEELVLGFYSVYQPLTGETVSKQQDDWSRGPKARQ